LTQNIELTQLGEEDANSLGALSPLPPYSPTALLHMPWALLISGGEGERTRWELLPKDAERKKNSGNERPPVGAGESGISIMGLSDIRPSDVFTQYTLGRSPKASFLVPRIQKSNNDSSNDDNARIYQWAYAMISNQHLKIYCTLNDGTTGSQNISVWLEDTSGNGTLVNSHLLLRRGERRLLNHGDEICLINPATLKRKVRSQTKLAHVLQQFSFVFLRQQARPSLGGTAVGFAEPVPGITLPWQVPLSTRKAAVNARATTTGREPTPKSKSSSTSAGVARPPRRRLEDDYDLRDLIGEGTTGLVRRAIHRRTGQIRAVKMIRVQKAPFSNASASALASVQAEAKILQKLDHPYIVRLDDFYVTESFVYLVMELLPGGDLFDRIVDKGRYEETESRRVMRRLLAAVSYLHEKENVVHRDLKPENILLARRDSDIDVKLTDFGVAKTVNDDGCKTFCGTPLYFAPEVLRRQGTVMGRGRYGKPADMWSLGIILYILLSGTQPFGEDNALVFPEEDWSHVSVPATDLIRRLLQIDPSRRLTVKQACQHEWILIDDGDTHTHPLSDPVIVALGRKEKAQSGEESLTKSNNLSCEMKQQVTKDEVDPAPSSVNNVESTKKPGTYKIKTNEGVIDQNSDTKGKESLQNLSSPVSALEATQKISSTTESEEEADHFDTPLQPRNGGKAARVSDETEARRPLSPTSFNTRSEKIVLSGVPPKLMQQRAEANPEIEYFCDADESITSFATTEEEKKSLAVAAKRATQAKQSSKTRKRRRTSKQQAAAGDSLAALVDDKQTTLSSWIKTSKKS
jgi:serine/threonine protein kinase